MISPPGEMGIGKLSICGGGNPVSGCQATACAWRNANALEAARAIADRRLGRTAFAYGVYQIGEV